MATTTVNVPGRKREVLDKAVIRFCGDSGDGMQITGSQFTNTVALYGNDLATLPDFPAEIRAPAGTLPGVSGFQVHFSSSDVFTPGDTVDALVAMNPGRAENEHRGPEAQRHSDRQSATTFGELDLRKAQMTSNPLEDHSLDGYRLFPVEPHQADARRAAGSGPRRQEHGPLQEFLRAGHVLLALQPLDGQHASLDRGRNSRTSRSSSQANRLAMQAGYSYCEATEAFQISYEIPPAKLAPGIYRNISGNTALAMGFVAASQKAGLPLFLGSYPITPASDILARTFRVQEISA